MTTTSGKKTAKRGTWNRAVSKKFYDFIHYQICLAKEVSDDEEVRVEVMMDRFDEYIDKGTVKVDFNNTEYVVFSMLQPYIDQAVDRSRRAREAAVRRRAARQAAIAQECDEASDTPITTDTHADKNQQLQSAPLSREEKRAIRREEARQRRQQRHDKRLQNRSKHPASQQQESSPIHVISPPSL